ncbi:MAG TPA: phycobilisome rod-core linker polypeptide, partial [Longimicrobium sp.]
FTYSGSATYATAVGTILLRPGTDTLMVEVHDQAGHLSIERAYYTYNVPPAPTAPSGGTPPAPAAQPAMDMATTPTRAQAIAGLYQQVLERAAQQPEIDYWLGRLASEPALTIKGIVREIALSPTYRQMHVVNAPSTREAAARLYRHLFAREAAGPELDYWAQYLAGGQDYSGIVDVMLADPGYVQYFGDHRVPGRPVAFWDAARTPLVVLPNGTGPDLHRGLCLTIAAGPGAAYECGDLRVVHGLPAVRTLNKGRAPTLIYNSQHAQPTPLVAADVTIPGDRTAPVRVDADLWVAQGTSTLAAVDWKAATRSWTTNMATDWVPGQARRIALTFNGQSLSTGPHAFAMEVRATYADSSVQTWIQRGSIPVVNRIASPYGAGWWVAGVEQLFFPGENRLFWVGGDGSTRLYEHRPQVDNGHVYVAQTPDRGLDTIRWNPYYHLPWMSSQAGGAYERREAGGVRVYFDTQTGQHGATVNRLDHHTHFAYDASGGLASLHVPTAAGYSAFKPAYRFEYNGPSRTL